jgi:hypothetical protein
MTDNRHIKKNRGILLLGCLAVLGTTIGVIADYFSGWSDNSNAMTTAFSLDLENIRGLFEDKPRWTYILGNYLAIIFLPFHIIGSYLIYLALRPINKKYAKFYFYPAVYLAVIGTGYHGTYAFVADIIQSGNEDLLTKMLDYWLYWGAFLAVGYSILTIYAFVLILKSKSIFPKWIAFLSPLSIILITTIISFILPNNMSGTKTFLTVTGLNLPLAIFYFITTKYLLKEKKVDLIFP